MLTKDELQQTIAGLQGIKELMSSGVFQLDKNYESELLEAGAIEMDTFEMAECLDETITILKGCSAISMDYDGDCNYCDDVNCTNGQCEVSK